MSFDGDDVSILVVFEGANFEASEPRATAGGDAIVVEEVPFALILDDGVVGCPSYDWCEDYATIGERAHGAVADGVAEEVGVASGVGEIVLAVVLMNP